MATIETIWLDCDPGLDDALAILLAAHHERINLIGISTSPGNTTLQNTTRNALDLLYNIGKQHIPVIKGSNILIKGEMDLATHMHGENGLGGVQIPHSPVKAIEEDNFGTIYKFLCDQPEKVTWANTGSLTNLCHFLRKYPEATEKIKQIVIMGGSTGRGNRTPAAQFNVYFDPHAFDEVLKIKREVPLVMVPLDTTNQVECTEQVFTFLEKRSSIPIANALDVMMKNYQAMYKKAYDDILYPLIHDPTVIYYILYPEKFITKKCLIVVDVYEISYGRTNVYYNDPKHPQIDLKTQDKVSLKLIDVGEFWQEMMKILIKIFDQVTHQTIAKIVDS